MGCTALKSDDLLGPQGDLYRFFSRQRQHFVHRIRMQRLGPAENSGQRLQGCAHNIIFRFLRRKTAPRRLGMKAHLPGARVLSPKTLLHMARPDPASCAVLADLFKKIEMGVKEKRETRRKVIDVEAGLDPRLDIGEAVSQRESKLLHCSGAGFPNMITADADSIPARHLARRKSKYIGDQPHRRLRGKDPRFLRGIFFKDIVLDSAAHPIEPDPPLQGAGKIEAPENGGGSVDRHRGGDLFKGDRLKKNLHIFQRINRHPAAPHLPSGAGVIGVIAHDRGHIEGHAQPRLPLLQQIAVTPVRIGGITETGKLSHRPEPAAVHIRLHTPGKGIFAGKTEIAPVIQICSITGRVKILDLLSGYCFKGPWALLFPLNPAAPLFFGPL